MTTATYYMYPCDSCHMNSERIRDKWLILSHMSKSPDKKGNNEKKKKIHLLFFWGWYPTHCPTPTDSSLHFALSDNADRIQAYFISIFT